MATTNKVKGWTGVLMIEDSSSHWPTKRRQRLLRTDEHRTGFPESVLVESRHSA